MVLVGWAPTTSNTTPVSSEDLPKPGTHAVSAATQTSPSSGYERPEPARCGRGEKATSSTQTSNGALPQPV